MIKRRLTKSITNDSVDRIYDAIIASGAYGAKLCGAGGGGFFVALIAPERSKILGTMVAPLAVIPIDIDVDGTHSPSSSKCNANIGRKTIAKKQFVFPRPANRLLISSRKL